MNMQSINNLTQRVIVGSIATCVMFTTLYLSFGTYAFFLFISLIALLTGTALWEYYALTKAINFKPLSAIAIFFSLLYVIGSYLSSPAINFLPALPQLTLLMAGLTVFGYYFKKGHQPIANTAITLFGIFYLTLPLSLLISINYLFPINSPQDGRLWVLYLLLVTKMTDVGAYFSGKAFGKYKIAPYISPSKTIEGAIGGLITSTVTSIITCFSVSLFTSYALLSFWDSLWLGALLGVIGQFGDLAESLLKREAKIKDSNQLPGLGGVLDVVDSLIFTAPLLYFFLIYKFY